MLYDKEARCPYGWGTKWSEFALQDADSLDDDEVRTFLKALITPKQAEQKDNYTAHGLVIYNSGKTSLGDIRAATSNFEYTQKGYWNCDLKEVRVCGYGITRPAAEELDRVQRLGLNIRFINLT